MNSPHDWLILLAVLLGLAGSICGLIAMNVPCTRCGRRLFDGR